MTLHEFVNSHKHCAVNDIPRDCVEYVIDSFDADPESIYDHESLLKVVTSIKAIRFKDGFISGFLGGGYYELHRRYAHGAQVEAVCYHKDLDHGNSICISNIESLL